MPNNNIGPTSIEVTGEDIESAVQEGLKTLGLARENVMIVVLEEPTRRMLGLGSTPARVQLTAIEVPKPPTITAPTAAPTVEESEIEPRRPAPRRTSTTAKPAAPRPATPRSAPQKPAPIPASTSDDSYEDDPTDVPVQVESARPDRPDRADHTDRPARPERRDRRDSDEYPEEPPVSEEQLAEDAQVGARVLETLLEKMRVQGTVTPSPARLEEEEAQHWTLQVTGPNLGRLIGRRGETLAALQYITRLIVSKEIGRRANLVIDVEGFKARREEQLRRLANKLADQAIQTGRMVAMEPMPPNERRIIHITLRPHPDVTTESIGEGDRRKVTIMPRRSRG